MPKPPMCNEAKELLVPTFELVSWPVMTSDPLTREVISFDIAKEMNGGMSGVEAFRLVRSRNWGRIRFVDLSDTEEMDV